MNYKEWKRAELGHEDLNGSAKQQIAGRRYGKKLRCTLNRGVRAIELKRAEMRGSEVRHGEQVSNKLRGNELHKTA